jgi:cobalt-zinc-cadmium efflux system protein
MRLSAGKEKRDVAHSHDHSREHPHLGDRRVLLAVLVNVGLTVAQIVGGIVGGSLALVADAIHNLSDAVSLGIAFAARRIGRRPASDDMTFGYGRAEVVAALVNYTTLIVIAIYLVYEAIWRLFEPQGVDGWIVVIVAGVALTVDLITAVLTYRMSKESMNIRAAFLHNLADALGSVAVIVAGTLIILFDWTIADALITLAIAGYILWLVATEIGGVIRILMLGTPPDLSPAAVLETLRGLDGVDDVHHLHIWQLDEQESSLEAHVVMSPGGRSAAEVKRAAKEAVADRYGIRHSTFEIEGVEEDCPDVETVGHTRPAR